MLSPSSVLSSGFHASSTSVAGCSAQGKTVLKKRFALITNPTRSGDKNTDFEFYLKGGQVTTSDADSGVFEAASSSTATRTSKTRNLQKEGKIISVTRFSAYKLERVLSDEGTKTSSLSSSQVRIKLRYAEAEVSFPLYFIPTQKT